MPTTETTGVRGEVRADLHRSIKKWAIDNDYTMERIVAEAIEEWSAKREIELLYQPVQRHTTTKPR